MNPKHQDRLPAQKKKQNITVQQEVSSAPYFDGMVEYIPEALIATDNQHVVIGWNAAAERIYGWKAEDVLGKTLKEILQTEYQDTQRDHVISKAREAGTWSGEVTQLRKDGKRIPIRSSVSVVKDKQGAPIGYIGINCDISDQKQTEETLANSEAKFHFLFDSVPQGMVHQDADGRVIDANPAAQKILGLTLDQLQGRTSLDPSWKSIHEDGSEFPGETHPAMLALQTGKNVSDVIMGVYNPATDEYRWLNINAIPRFHPGDKAPYEVYVTFEDITERIQAEKALRQSEQKFSTLFEKSVFASSLSSLPDGVIVAVNEAFERAFGYTKQEAIGRTSLELGINPDAEGRARMLAELKEHGSARNQELALRTKSNEVRIFSVNVDLMDIDGLKYILNTTQDITERKRAEKQVVQMKRLYATLSQVNQTIVRVKDRVDLYQSICDVAAKFGEFSLAWVGLLDEGSGEVRPVAAVGQDINHWPFAPINIHSGQSRDGLIAGAIRTSKTVTSEDIGNDERIKSQTELIQKYGYHSTAVVPFRLRGKTIGVMALISGIPGFFNSEDEIRLLDEMGLDISFALDTMETEAERRQVEDRLRESEQLFSKIFPNSPVAMSMVSATDGKNIEVNDAWCILTGFSREEALGHDTGELKIFSQEERNRLIKAFSNQGYSKHLDSEITTKSGGKKNIIMSSELITTQENRYILVSVIDITERKQAENSIRLAEQQYRLLFEESPVMVVLTELNNTEVLIAKCNQRFLSTLGYDQDKVIGKSLAGFYSAASRVKLEQSYLQTMKGILLSEERELITHDGRIITVLLRAVPRVNAEGTVIGTQASYIDITERKQAEKKVQVQLQRLSALSEIDHAINSSMDMRLSLDILLTQVISQLDVDAASVLLLNPASQTLEYVAGKGFRTTAIRKSSLRLGVGFAGQVGLERKVLHVKDLNAIGTQFQRRELLKEDNFSEYFGVPLVAKGMLKGVLEVFHRSQLDVDSDWMNFMETLGGQAAIAIDNVQLFDDMQKSNLELITAYDATITGWSQAMDLRDKETEGHTQRVTEMTVRLAMKLGIGQQEIVQFRRGALLHDIGKLGIPDNILLKPDKLTDIEWAIMRQHPKYAYKMLLPITYLRPALDIPYCHHEKWDGSGYPRGLREEQIPLSARIFAIVDVWDALRSDRPYRASWSVEKTREHIIEGSGTHFDPQVVEAFLVLLDEEPDLR